MPSRQPQRSTDRSDSEWKRRKHGSAGQDAYFSFPNPIVDCFPYFLVPSARVNAAQQNTAGANDTKAVSPFAPSPTGAFLTSPEFISANGAATYSSIGSNGATGAQVQQALGESGLSVTGTGITVGVLSDSFNDLGGAAQDEANGALPTAAQINILKDLSSGGTDEGRAMMQVVHDVAPGASLAFYTAFNSEQDFANGILALADAGCKVICDDVSYFDEPFFQNGIVAQAIQTVEAKGVCYLTAAGNDASTAYQASWTPISGTYNGVTLTDAESFAGSLAQTITIGATWRYSVPLLLEWDQPYGYATSNLEVLVFKNGRLIGTATNSTVAEPTNPWVALSLTAGATYQIAVENLSGPDPGLIKIIAAGNGIPVTISGANVGTVFGHAMTPGAIAVGAVNSADTPAFGVDPAVSESFSASGAGTELLFDNQGNPLPSPDLLSPVAISGVDNINTTISGGLGDFYGTSAATPSVAGIVALMLQTNPNLTPAQVYQILQDSALAMANPDVSGAGLAQANAAVSDAVAMLTVSAGQVFSIPSGQTFTGLMVLSGGTLVVLSTGHAIDSTLNGGIEFVRSGGTDSGTINNGGDQFVYGATTSAMINSGGIQYAYGTATSTTINDGGAEYVYSGGTASTTSIGSGGKQSIVAGGVASDTTIDSGGRQYDHGAVSGTVINGGNQFVYASATNTAINSGGIQYEFGTATRTTIAAGGKEYVYAGASANSTTVSGGVQAVVAGGTALDTLLESGGRQYNRGTASGAMIDSGGMECTFSGGVIDSATINGGTLEIMSGGLVGSNPITFASGGMLQLDASTAFGGQISGFGGSDQIDLRDIGFNSGTTTLGYSGGTTSGILTVGDGTHTANLALLGNYTAGSFVIAVDGHGGTLVKDPPLVG